MYEIYRRTLNGKLNLIAEFNTIEEIVAGIWKGASITEYFGYTNIDRKQGNVAMFGETHTTYDWCYYEGSTYKYVVEHNGKIVAPDRLLGVWRECKYQQSLRKEYWVNKRIQHSQGRKPQAIGGFRQMNTKQERTWAHAWDDEEFAPKPRVARTNRNLPDAWWDIHWYTHKSWKIQSKRKHQWKEK